MKIIEGILFDIDGTLISTNELIFATFNYVTKKYLDKELTPSELIALFGPTEEVILKEFIPFHYENAREDYYRFYNDNHDKMVKVIPGINQLLSKIKAANIPLGIFTGKGRTSTEITLEKIGAYRYFDLIITGDDVANHKPSADGIIRFIDKFRLAKENVLLVGDAPADIQAARNAGIKIASVLWDSYAREEVLQLKSDFYFYSVESLSEFILSGLIKEPV